MVKIGKYLPIVILICIGLAFATADAQENLAQQVSAIFQQNCLNCHGPSGSFKEALLIERNALIDTQVVIIGNPENSEFYKRLLGPTEKGPQMPLNLPPLSPEAVETIARWITAGAPDWDVQHDINFITTDTILNTIRNHLKSLDPFDRPSARYFTMTHLYNAGESPETLSDYRIALSKLVNSLSWKFEITNPTPIDKAQTIFYIDLRRYEWNTTTDVWTQIEQVYPYNIAFDPEIQAGLLEKLTHLQTETDSTVPFVHVDWFLATASLPPLYHDILGLPQTDRVLEAQLEVNVASNIRNAPGIDVWRAGFNDSGVSSNNRVVERHTSRYGAYWKSYDFAGSVGSQNIFTHPLDFTHDGGEIIFNLPNGLQAYLLVDVNGNRLNDAPIDIVRNLAASNPTVRNGLSCIGCHTQGMKKFEDSVRAAIEQDDNPPYNKEQALRLYAKQSVLDNLVAKDTLRFQQALEKIGGPFADDASRQHFFKQHESEPIQRFHESFQAPLNVRHAAAAVGLETEAFLAQVRVKQSLKNLGLQTLTDMNGTVKRDAWTSNFHDLISALNTPDSVLPPIVQRPERIPGASVHIPDSPLRKVIEDALNKTPGSPITVAEMATLRELEAGNRDIRDLTGLEFATNLGFLNVESNSISDISPLAGLTNLTELKMGGNPISDISPLASLTKLRQIWFNDTEVADLSPLASLRDLETINAAATRISSLAPLEGLTKLRILETIHSDISDLSPLAGLTNLTRLLLYDCKATDLLPLRGLTKLRWLGFPHTNNITDFSPLSGLTELRHLDLFHTEISDLSPLAKLINLETLILDWNRIVDVSPLASLHNLKTLYLHVNNIEDFSPLDGIRKNIEVFTWHRNPGYPKGGPKIEGPWLWLMLQSHWTEGMDQIDHLSKASNGKITEQQIATLGTADGERIGDSVWLKSTLEPYHYDDPNRNYNNLRRLLLPEEEVVESKSPWFEVYSTITLYSPRAQHTRIFIGAADSPRKVLLNGELVYHYEHYVDRDAWNTDYQDFFPITLRKGKNVLLVHHKYNTRRPIGYFFGFEPGTEYSVVNPRVGYTFSEPKIHVGDTFTLDLSTENIYDLAGWQFDIAFDPTVLEVVEVNEGDFLKTGGETTFFQKGTIDNSTGKITKLSSARLSEDGVSGTGTLLSVMFTAKTAGQTQLKLENFQLAAITGVSIPAGPQEVVITVEGQLATGDVNRDGQVNILDMVLVARHFGKTVPPDSDVDLNGDGVVNIQDLIIVAQHLGETTSAAPSIFAVDDIEGIDPAMIQVWIEQAQVEDDGSIAFRKGIANLEQLLTLFIPETTALLNNYPNPFNPETWIPYQLSEPAEVTLRIYAVNGSLIRTLALGQMPAGIYQIRPRAAYWDGKNDLGESVASGVYFYTLTAGNFTATKKMLIRK
ncbi:MAG: leucine-rich repeat domain-containing protein [Candidatus Poribacteria bacterium]|nr:leucine-rich repeat domain-containing protein [Candidatus Poribacteria bacterium]